MKKEKIKLFIVDDDIVYLKLIEIEFSRHSDYMVETYATGEECLAHLSNNPDVIILDYLLNGVKNDAINGIETLDKIKAINPNMPVVMLSSQDKIEVAVDCMHHKAFDYIVKSETAFIRLHKVINAILKYNKIEKELNWYMARM